MALPSESITVDIGSHDVFESVESSETPVSPRSPDQLRSRSKVPLTLRQAWENAEQQFMRDSGGKRLTLSTDGKDSVMQKWKAAYEVENAEDQRHSDRMASILRNILNSVELVGAFASKAASTVFPPSEMCFNAISFLIDAPKQIKKVYDGLKDLFHEVEEFLTKFHIYQRIDDKFGLDLDLILNTNNLLISFVRICGLATGLLHGGRWTKFKTGFKVVLFRDDSGVPAELKKFRRLAQYSNTLTNTVTLEHVLQNEDDTRQILGGVSTLVAASNDEKMKLANRDRVRKLEEMLFKGTLSYGERDYTSTLADPLPNTFEALSGDAAYNRWMTESDPANPILVIWGSAGSGKTSMMDVVKAHLDSMRQTAERNDPGIYVTAYSFADKRSKIISDRKRSTTSLISHALKILALQVAGQSTNYANDLMVRLKQQDKLHSEDDIKKLWKVLRLAEFTAIRRSSLYILLDAVHEESIDDRKDLLDLLAESVKSQKPGLPNMRVLFTMTANEQTINKMVSRGFLAISANDINKKLIVSFVGNEMQQLGIYQDADRVTVRQKQEDTKKLSIATNDINFNSVRQKLIRLREAIEIGLPREDVMKVFEEGSNVQMEEEGKATLADLQRSLSSYDTTLLKSILMWLSGSRLAPTLARLEAALHLEQVKLPIEPLVKKIKNKFHKAVYSVADMVYLDSKVDAYLCGLESSVEAKAGLENQALVTLDISIRNASESTVKQFIWDLNESMVSGKFDFKLANTKVQTLRVDKLTTHLTITRLCFKLLNEGWTEETKLMLSYALSELPRHLVELQQMQGLVSEQDRKMIGEGLVTFLNDPYVFEQQHQHYGDGSWLLDDANISAVRFWLQDDKTVKQLPLKERRWVNQAMGPEKGCLGFMNDQALSIGRRWLTDPKSDSYTLYDWIDSYLNAVDSNQERTNKEDVASEDAKAASEKASSDRERKVEENQSEQKFSKQNEKLASREAEIASTTTSTSSHQPTRPVNDPVADDSDHSASSEHSENGEKSPPADAVARALNWVSKKTEVREGAVYHLNLGDTYRGDGEIEKSLQHYRSAMHDQRLRPYVLHGIALCHASREQFVEVVEHATESLTLFSHMADNSELDEFDINNYAENLRHWALEFDKQRHYAKALEFHEKAFRHKPDDIRYGWINFKLRCLVDEGQEAALQLLEAWMADDENFPGQSPAFSMLDMADQDEFNIHLLPLVRNIKNEDLRGRVLTVIADAISLAGKGLSKVVHTRLYYLRGVACALSSDLAKQAEAVEHFERALTALPQEGETGWSSQELLQWASNNITKYKFESLQAKLLVSTDLAIGEKRDMLLELQDYINRTTRDCAALDSTGGVDTSEGFIVAFCALSNLNEETRRLCQDEINEGLDILSDSDPDNDRLGLSILAGVFCRLGDVIGVLTSFSLLDRKILQQRQATDSPDRTQRTMEEKLEEGFWRQCDGCNKDIFSSDPGGIWWCQFCPNFDLCPDCKTDFESGSLRIELCNRSHVPWFMHLVHAGYTAEELMPDKVRVDWLYQADEHGNRSRSGGEVVDKTEWIRRLRQSWTLPQSGVNVSGVQK